MMRMEIDTNTLSPHNRSRGSRRKQESPIPIPTRRAGLPVRLFWRVRQFVRGIFAHVDADEMLVTAHVLPKAALVRFCSLPLDAQRHSLNVLYTLHEAGWDDPDLAVAALLHDVGKVAGDEAGITLSPWLRSILVLLDTLAPNKMAQHALDDPATGWRYLLHVHRQHPAIGAAWAAADGCSETACWLIAHHQDRHNSQPTEKMEKLLALLQWADSQN